jgi:hypothetical protein
MRIRCFVMLEGLQFHGAVRPPGDKIDFFLGFFEPLAANFEQRGPLFIEFDEVIERQAAVVHRGDELLDPCDGFLKGQFLDPGSSVFLAFGHASGVHHPPLAENLNREVNRQKFQWQRSRVAYNCALDFSMTLELSPDELRTLLHMISLALYTTEPNQDEACHEQIEAMQQLAERIYAAGSSEGHRDIAEYDPAAGQYMLKDDYVNDSVYSRTIREFEDDFFWSELAYLLAERDLRVKGGEPLDPVKHNERLQDIEEYYMEMFTDYGVDRLHLISPEPHQ